MNKARDDRRYALGPVAALLAGALVANGGCGDGPICASEIVIVISSIADGDTVTTDVSPEPGVQINVPIRSNLREGDVVTLIVSDPMGTELERLTTESDADGDAEFASVNVSAGLVVLRAEAAAGDCGIGADEVQFNVLEGGACGLSVREGLLESDYYAPLPVLNTSNDSDMVLPGFQANIDVSTSENSAVELFVLDIDSATENSAGVVSADALGVATFPLTLAEGRQALRAVCVSGVGSQSASATVPLLVDTNAPVCTFAFPADGSSIIPQMDEDGDPLNGTQVTLIGSADALGGNDVEGEVATFMVNGMAIDGTLLDASGQSTSTAQASFDNVGIFSLAFTAQDRAGNVCAAIQDSNYVTDGCAISLVAPTGPVSTDANGTSGDGMQVDLTVDVDVACENRAVTTDCGEGMTMGTVPAGGGNVTMQVTACPDTQCEVADPCTISVTNDAGIETSVGTTLEFDNRPPTVDLQFINPPASCGGAVAPGQDIDLVMPGLQIAARVIAPLAVDRSVEVSNPSMPSPFMADAGGDVVLTVEPGLNVLEAVALDGVGNEGRSGVCNLSVYDIVIGFATPIDDGLVGRNDGAVAGNQVTFDVCGTVSELGASVDVSIDGGAPQAATVMGNTWCLNNVTLDESGVSNPFHTIDVDASAGGQLGQGSINVVVDLTPPGPVAVLVGDAFNRHSARLSWAAPDNDGMAAAVYIIKVATTSLDDVNFDATGTVLPGPVPGTPGTGESQVATQLFAGTDYFFGVASMDAAGNRSPVQTVGPLTPDFDSTGAYPPQNPASGDNVLGYQVVHGDFNNDTYSDIALSAPFTDVDLDMDMTDEFGVGQVFIYFGSAAGPPSLAATPDITLTGGEAGKQFGNGLTALDWDGQPGTDLAVGSPFADGNNGRVYVFHGGSTGSLLTATGPADADVTISTTASMTNWFFFGAMGFSLASARFDNDTIDDLIIAVPFGGGGVGGIAVVYGGHSATSITLDDADPAPSNGAKTLAIPSGGPAAYDIFGQTLVNLGRTEGVGDVDDDLGVAFPDQNTAFIIRGRPQPASPGATVGALDFMTDLVVVDDSSDTEVFFGSAMASIADQNGDGARDIVIGSWGEGNLDGRVRIIDGDSVGNGINIGTIALTTINHGVFVNRHFGTAIPSGATAGGPADINADGVEDLLIVGGFNTSVAMFVWYGGGIPTGTTTADSADHKIGAPGDFVSTIPGSNDRPPVQATWAGDVNGDGLTDICWSDYTANSRDGAFEILWDDNL